MDDQIPSSYRTIRCNPCVVTFSQFLAKLQPDRSERRRSNLFRSDSHPPSGGQRLSHLAKRGRCTLADEGKVERVPVFYFAPFNSHFINHQRVEVPLRIRTTMAETQDDYLFTPIRLPCGKEAQNRLLKVRSACIETKCLLTCSLDIFSL